MQGWAAGLQISNLIASYCRSLMVTSMTPGDHVHIYGTADVLAMNEYTILDHV